MAVRRWHPGKLIIIWTWGGVIAGLLLTDFMSRPVSLAPMLHLIELLTSGALLIALSGVTWYWLGGREQQLADKSSLDAHAAGAADARNLSPEAPQAPTLKG